VVPEASVAARAAEAGDELLDDLRGDDVADVLGVAVLEALKSHTDALPPRVQRRPPAVPRVDGRVDLDGQQAPHAVPVRLHVHARDDALGDGGVLAADGVAADADPVVQRGQAAAEAERLDAFPERSSLFLLDLE